jgi:hypothetical protein
VGGIEFGRDDDDVHHALSYVGIFAGIGRLNEPELVQDRHHPSVTRLLRRYPAALILRAGRVRSHLKCFDTGRDAGVCSCG